MKRTIVTAILLALFVACLALSHSCANTTTPPGGGPKDTLPPVLVRLTPADGKTMFPVVDGKVTLLYDEYTVIKTAGDILLSPPTRRRPSARVKGKNIVVTFPDTLRENQTYTLDFGQALADNNEGNPAPRLVYTFSTGESLDSLYFTGKIINSRTLAPVKKALVAAYTDLSDSACFKTLPDAAAFSDDWGFFVMRNLRDTLYNIYAYTDSDSDFKYNPDGDEVAFLDSTFHPAAKINDSIYELKPFLMNDTLACQAREAMFTLLMFKELQSVQYLQNSGRVSERQGFLKFSAADVQINELEFVGIDSSAVILQYNQTRDSIDFWINTDYRLDDSLLIRLNYMKTDSAGALSPVDESLSLAVRKSEKTDAPAKAKQADTTFILTVNVKDETVEQLGISIGSDMPVISSIPDSIRLNETNPKGQVTSKGFTISQDTTDIRKYIIMPDEKLIKGYDYELVVPQGTFTNLEKLPNARSSAKFKVPQAENLSTLELLMTNVDGRYIVELTDERGSKVLRSYTVNSPQKLVFPYITAGKYMIRISADINGNGLSDTGNLLARKQPEPVRFYETSPGNKLLEIPESSEIEQTIDIKQIFQ